MFSCISLADGFGGAEGKNRLDQLIHIWGDVDYSISVLDKKRNTLAVYPFKDECKYTREEPPYEFSCSANGKSPLAGATYRVTESKTRQNVCGSAYTIYLCIAGCTKKSIPAVFYEQPYEC